VVDGAGVGDVLIERGVDYGLGKLADIYRLGRAGPAPLALLWHGIGVDERDVLEPLAAEAARLGLAVVVPDWDSEAPDGGRAHLRDFAAAAASHGWPVRLTEPDTDHAGIVMTEWDPARRRCRPTTEPHAVTAGRLTAQTIAEASRTIADAAR
jgi:hypothetical protein